MLPSIPVIRKLIFGDLSGNSSSAISLHSYNDESPDFDSPNKAAPPQKTNHITTFQSKYSSQSNSKISLVRTWLASSVDLQPSNPLKGADTPRDANGNVLITPWGIHWYTPVSIVLLFVGGVAGAVAHHYYYRMLHGTPAGDAVRQEWVNRIGTGLAFLSRAALSGVMEISRKQWVWVTLRKRFMTLGAISAMFGAAADPFHFLNGEMLSQAKFNTFMAILIWVLPVVAIFTPSTISVVSAGKSSVGPCTVPSLEFRFDADSSSRLKWYTLSTGNTLGDIYEEVYHNPSPRASSIFTTAAFSGKVAVASETTPGGTLAVDCGTDCTYKIQFEGPAVNCTEIAFWEADDPLSNSTIPSQSVNGLSPVYSASQAEKVWNEVLVGNLREPGSETKDPNVFEWHSYSCKNSVALYSVSLNITDGRSREPTIESVKILYPVTAEPSFNTTYSRAYIPNWALFDTLIEILAGDVSTGINHFDYSLDGQDYYKSTQETRITRTKVMSTPLASPKSTTNDMKTIPLLAEAIEVMVQKMVVSLLSDSSLIYATNVTSICTSRQSYNIYSYNWQRLFIPYASGAVVALIIGMLGFVALSKNGVASDDSFSTFLLTTRNPTLDQLAAGSCLGGEPLPNDLKKLKFKFGELVGQTNVDGVKHTGLGLEGEVIEIQRGGVYS